MGAGGPYPTQPYSDSYGEFSYSYSTQPGYRIPPNPIPPYVHPPIYRPGYAASFPLPPPPIHGYGPPMNGFHFHPGMPPNPVFGPDLFTLPRPGVGVLPPRLPPIPPHINMQLNRPGEYRFGEHRPDYFDEQ